MFFQLRKKNNQHLKSYLYHGEKGVVIRNINFDPFCEKQKRVLICYLNNQLDNLENQAVFHTNIEEKYIIQRYFIENNYIIDICDCASTTVYDVVKDIQYDIVFGFGSAYRKLYSIKNAHFIEYFTESPFWYSKQEEEKRISYHNEIFGTQHKVFRTGMFYSDQDENKADEIIHMCDGSLLGDVNKSKYRIYPHGLYNKKYVFNVNNKDKKNFLFFGTAGYIHKGLDVTIEAFRLCKDVELYVCGGLSEYLNENETLPPNVHDCGLVDVNSQEYINLVNKCMFVLLPSCSEASPSGVLTCMRHGLIPVVSMKLGLDRLECPVYFLDDYHIEYLSNYINNLQAIDTDALINACKDVYDYANSNFTIHEFRNRLYSALDEILGKL